MMIEVSVCTTASPNRVWQVLVDVARWPAWIESIISVQRLDGGPLRVGSRVRIRQPRMAALVWEVTDLDEGREFTWQARALGVLTVGRHRLAGQPDGGTLIVLSVDHHGPLAGLVSALTGSRTRRYVQMEADGLKAASEAGDQRAT